MAIIPAEEKVFMVSNSTNTTYSGSAALKAMQQWYTMQDVSDSIQPYKVFTALLTQSGEGGESDKNGGDDIFKGVTYYINENYDNGDFTIYGSPNNNVGTWFICNQDGVVPTGAQLLYNSGAPVATVLENTIGNVWFTYADVGIYNINSNELFSSNKTITFLQNVTDDSNNNFTNLSYSTDFPNSFAIITAAGGSSAPANANGILFNTPIEIRVYN